MGKFVVIEGGDGAGKGTQALRALETRNKEGIAALFDFPQYEDSLAGKIVGDALAGKYGDFRNLHPHLASLPYILDRVSAQGKLMAALSRGDVICNRYVPSNAMYQGAKFETEEEQDAFIEFIERLEYDELDLPCPDIVIYLHVPYEIGQELVKKKDVRLHLGAEQGVLDQHERDADYIRSVIALYRRVATFRSDWAVVECVRDGTLRTVEDIHKEVMELIRFGKP